MAMCSLLLDEIVMCVHREGGKNESDIMTKNPASTEFEKHSPKMCSEVPEELLEKVKKRRVLKCVEFGTLIMEDVRRMDNGGC